MKHTTFFIASVILAAFIIPVTPASALSCIDPEGMIDYIVESDDFVVVTATPTEQMEHVKEAADATDPNRQYPSGYTAQLLDITDVHKGSAPDMMWTYFERNGTWNYLCAGAPAALNTEQVYVLNQNYDMFGVTNVVTVYDADSELADELMKAIEDATTDETPEPTSYETDKAYWLQNLMDQLKDMAFMIEVKLAEWKFWNAS